MGEKFAVKSTKAMFNVLIGSIAFLVTGIYMLIVYKVSNQNLYFIGIVLIAIGTSMFLINIPSVFSPTDLICTSDEGFIINTFIRKNFVIKYADIESVSSRITIRKYLRPLNQVYYTYGTIIIRLKNKRIFILNVEDLKEIENKMNEIILKNNS